MTHLVGNQSRKGIKTFAHVGWIGIKPVAH
jgi:hypothetical protein